MHNLSFAVAQELRPALLVYELDFCACRCADAQCENHHALFGKRLRSLDSTFFEVLAVGEQYHDSAPLVFVHRAEGLVKAAANIRARYRDGFVVERHQRVLKATVVESERTLKKGLPGESDETEAATAAVLHEIEDGHPGALHPAGRHVGGEHAARAVHDEYEVFAQQTSGVFLLAPLWSCQRQAYDGHSSYEQGILEAPADRTVRAG